MKQQSNAVTKSLVESIFEDSIINRIKANVNINTVLGLSIVNGLNDENVNDKEVLKFIKEQAIDNPELMSQIIGFELTNEILNLK